jgi:hypothetical protein
MGSERMRPAAALIFAVILALPALAILILGLAEQRMTFSLLGLALFAAIVGFYYAAAYAVLCHAE